MITGMTTVTMPSGGEITTTATIEGFGASYTRATLFLSRLTLQTYYPGASEGFYAMVLPHFLEYETLESGALHSTPVTADIRTFAANNVASVTWATEFDYPMEGASICQLHHWG